MPQPTFFIYDYETFGIRPAADRPAQFAGIRTDPDFNPVADPVILYCKQTNDYLPSPESVLITGITPQECNQKGIPEPEFARAGLRRIFPAQHLHHGLQQHPLRRRNHPPHLLP